MLELLTRPTADRALLDSASTACLSYHGPERRTASSLGWQLFANALNEIDYGVLLLDEDGRLLHANRVANYELDESHPLQLRGADLRARAPEDVEPLRAALHDALRRGLRRLLTLGQKQQRPVGVSVVPLPRLGSEERGATLVILGRRQVGAALAVQGFARIYGLTCGETRVLVGLSQGDQPAEIARVHGVAISTVRTQIGSIRQKTGAPSIRGLLRQVAALPPLMGVLRSAA